MGAAAYSPLLMEMDKALGEVHQHEGKTRVEASIALGSTAGFQQWQTPLACAPCPDLAAA